MMKSKTGMAFIGMGIGVGSAALYHNIKNGNMFYFLGLDKMILLYQHSTEEYNCVYKLFESSQDRWSFYQVGNSLAKLCKADISEIDALNPQLALGNAEKNAGGISAYC